jgi:hypothetical protein
MLPPGPRRHARSPACGGSRQSDIHARYRERLPLAQGSWGRSCILRLAEGPCPGGSGGVPPTFSFSLERSSAKSMRSEHLCRFDAAIR